MHIHKNHLFRAALGASLMLFSVAGCDAEEELEDLTDEEIADQEALDEEEEADDSEFRSSNDYFDPVGNHDVATCSTLAGWAKDGDTTAATQVHIYKGAPYPAGQIVTHVWADRFRGDLPFADKNHGFHIATPNAFKTGCPERVYIHAIDLDASGNFVPGGNNRLLNSTGRTVVCGPPPPGGCGFGGGDDGPPPPF
ncbi:MAG: hypothetical protein AAF799_33990 [Myxococcota bacterium]